jgi:hypothetical protein
MSRAPWNLGLPVRCSSGCADVLECGSRVRLFRRRHAGRGRPGGPVRSSGARTSSHGPGGRASSLPIWKDSSTAQRRPATATRRPAAAPGRESAREDVSSPIRGCGAGAASAVRGHAQ